MILIILLIIFLNIFKNFNLLTKLIFLKTSSELFSFKIFYKTTLYLNFSNNNINKLIFLLIILIYFLNK